MDDVAAAADFLASEASGPLQDLKHKQESAHQAQVAEFEKSANRVTAPAQQRNELSRLLHLAEETADAINRVGNVVQQVREATPSAPEE